MEITISNKGWVVIPAALRRKYHLQPGSVVQMVDYGGVLAIVPSLTDPRSQTRGILAAGEGEKSLIEELLEEHRLEQQHG